jgi:uncharacterized membrane protein YiaA
MKAKPKNEVKELNIPALVSGFILVCIGIYGLSITPNHAVALMSGFSVSLIGAYLIWRS